MPEISTAPVLSCTGLQKRFGQLVAVAHVDLELRRGECFGLLGPNGAGKTTTIEILEGLQPADAGEVRILGLPAGAPGVRERVGIALQETQLPEKLTVLECVRLFRSFYHRGRDVDEVIHHLELDEKRQGRVAKLSGGQRQRLALACALVGDPELLFLDEPSTGLDPQARLKVWEIVLAFKAQGGTLLLTTHYMEEAARLCDRLAIPRSWAGDRPRYALGADRLPRGPAAAGGHHGAAAPRRGADGAGGGGAGQPQGRRAGAARG